MITLKKSVLEPSDTWYINVERADGSLKILKAERLDGTPLKSFEIIRKGPNVTVVFPEPEAGSIEFGLEPDSNTQDVAEYEEPGPQQSEPKSKFISMRDLLY